MSIMDDRSLSEELRSELAATCKRQALSILLLLVVIVVVSLWRSNGKNAMQMQWREDSVSFTDPEGEEFSLAYADITSTEYVQSWDRGDCLDGGSNSFYHYGLWHNDAVGDYHLYASTSCDSCILFRYDGGYLAVSYESDETTHALYESILPLLPARAS